MRRVLALGALAFSACAAPSGAPLAEPSTPSGIVLLSLSGLRADALGAAGRTPSPTPFLDSLARRGRFFEHGFAASPNTQVSHLSLLTGLFPPEHRVQGLRHVLSPDVPLLQERLAAAGFRTAGFTAGGYLTAAFGFDRGFDDFAAQRTDAEPGPLDRAAAYLRTVADDAFFLFVQSHDLDPPLDGSETTASPPPPDAARVNAGFLELAPDDKAAATRRYLESVRRLDASLARFLATLEALELDARTILVVTADHGTELGEHGRLAHTQVYPESIHVPLLIVGPGVAPGRESALTSTTSVAPTLAHLVGLQSAGPTLPGFAGAEGRGWAYASTPERWSQETLILQEDQRLRQFVASRLRGEHDGTWVTRSVTFDTREPHQEFEIVAFSEQRPIAVAVDGREGGALRATLDWRPARLELGSEGVRRRVTLAADGCASPADSGMSADSRCLSFKVRGLDLERLELFDLTADPLAARDLSFDEPVQTERLRETLARYAWQPAPAPGPTRPGPDDLAQLAARAELPEPPLVVW